MFTKLQFITCNYSHIFNWFHHFQFGVVLIFIVRSLLVFILLNTMNFVLILLSNLLIWSNIFIFQNLVESSYNFNCVVTCYAFGWNLVCSRGFLISLTHTVQTIVVPSHYPVVQQHSHPNLKTWQRHNEQYSIYLNVNVIGKCISAHWGMENANLRNWDNIFTGIKHANVLCKCF